MPVASPCMCAQEYTWQDVNMGLSTTLPLDWVVRNFYFTWVSSGTTGIGDPLWNLCLLVKLRDPAISLTLANSPAWKRAIECGGRSPGIFFHGCPVSRHTGEARASQVFTVSTCNDNIFQIHSVVNKICYYNFIYFTLFNVASRKYRFAQMILCISTGRC